MSDTKTPEQPTPEAERPTVTPEREAIRRLAARDPEYRVVYAVGELNDFLDRFAGRASEAVSLRPTLCPGDDKPCYVDVDPDEAHWRCGTVQCGKRGTPPPGDVVKQAREIIEAAFDEANHSVVFGKTKQTIDREFYDTAICHVATALQSERTRRRIPGEASARRERTAAASQALLNAADDLEAFAELQESTFERGACLNCATRLRALATPQESAALLDPSDELQEDLAEAFDEAFLPAWRECIAKHGTHNVLPAWASWGPKFLRAAGMKIKGK